MFGKHSGYGYIRYSYSVKISFPNIFVFVFGQEFDIRVTLIDEQFLGPETGFMVEWGHQKDMFAIRIQSGC